MEQKRHAPHKSSTIGSRSLADAYDRRPPSRRSHNDTMISSLNIENLSAEKRCIEVVEAYFDPKGRPAKRQGLEAARISRAYDARGNQVEEAYFNGEGKPTIRKDLGAARISWRYNDQGQQVESALYGPDGTQLKCQK